ncbi:cohesin domain-containing protein [Paenibacillus hexagrammi]|uniref:Cohesin domain-containing protein n=1 Tax=Paenibacillus hexagrammi TaxID=2908839 RepID=A0ABY3SBK8_9BACL|nr:cohesin domain-containing protein [Paenibacillus sp. YPD9-1]UJF31334.1 cohesin domain-containing protein [Paenibacillus sp. YPD9-1]
MTDMRDGVQKQIRVRRIAWLRVLCSLLVLLIASPLQRASTTYAAEMTQATAALSGTSAVSVNETFPITYGLNVVTGSVYAQDVTFAYDPERVEFLSAESVQEGFQIIEEKQAVGQVRLVAASIGSGNAVHQSEDLIRVLWKAKPSAQTADTNITLSSIRIADGEGQEVNVASVTHKVTISSVDKSALLDIISDAQAKHDAAVEGTSVGQYPIGAKAALQQAIDAAQHIANDPAATADQVSQAAEQLKLQLDAFTQSVNKSSIEGDLNGDRKLSIGDLGIVAAAIGKSSSDPDWLAYLKADLNHDGKVDAEDLSIVARWILTGIPAPEQEPKAVLDSVYGASVGQSFDVTFGITNVTGSVYAQDVTFTYDPALLELVSIDAIHAEYPILEQKDVPNGVRVLLIHKPEEASDDEMPSATAEDTVNYVKLQLKVLEGAADQSNTASIEVAGTIADSNGHETSLTGTSRTIHLTRAEEPGSGDLNSDGHVTVGDLAIMVKGYGKTSADEDWSLVKSADLNADNRIDILDLSEMAHRILQ